MTSWDEIRGLISAGDADKLIERLITLDDAERKLVAGELRGHIPVLSRHAETKQQERWMEEARRREKDRDYWMHWREPEHEPWQDWADLLRLAGAGTLSAVSAVASWVTRRDLAMWRSFAGRTEFGAPAPVVRLLDHRPAEWQAELAVRLAAKVRGPGDPGAPLALAMLRHTGAPPPEHDPLVVAWAVATTGAEHDPVVEAGTAAEHDPLVVTGAAGGTVAQSDPLLPALLPRLFEAEGVGRALQFERADPISPWFRTLRAAGERDVLLDGCVRRFLRGGTAQDLRFFARLHELLEPTTAEIDARRRDYLRLLPAAPGPVAELSLRHLRRLDAHDPADVAEALEGLLFRAEAKLVRSGLTWFDQTVRQAPDRADELVAARSQPSTTSRTTSRAGPPSSRSSTPPASARLAPSRSGTPSQRCRPRWVPGWSRCTAGRPPWRSPDPPSPRRRFPSRSRSRRSRPFRRPRRRWRSSAGPPGNGRTASAGWPGSSGLPHVTGTGCDGRSTRRSAAAIRSCSRCGAGCRTTAGALRSPGS
ncbi:MAG TPA: hypothetical protein VM347_05655 [Nonomuraea sp.]|nr:hypothetical protein [Nonomuraea sp.]